MRNVKELLNEFVDLLIEQKLREVDISNGSRVPHGSIEHINDLENRISDLITWRNRYKKGTESRANYSRLINKLKLELASAKRAAEK